MRAYGIYQNIRDSSWQCLLDFKINSLPVDILKIAHTADIRVIKNSSVDILFPDENGRSYYDGNKWYIIYDDTAAVEKARFTIAHELGHIFLGHQLQYVKYSRTRQVAPTAVSEKQADRFALRLLCPACVLWGLSISTAEELAKVCRVDISVAQERMKRMKKLYVRDKFLTSSLEKKVFNGFDDYIRSFTPLA